MTKRYDGLRGEWHASGMYWFCDCAGAGGVPLLRVGMGAGGFLTRKANPPSKHYCKRCQIYRPYKRNRPDPFGKVETEGGEP